MGVGIVLFLGGFGVRVTQSKKNIYIYIYIASYSKISLRVTDLGMWSSHVGRRAFSLVPDLQVFSYELVNQEAAHLPCRKLYSSKGNQRSTQTTEA